MRRRIGVIAAITRQIGRMRPTRGRRCGRRSVDARPTRGRRAADVRPTQCGRLNERRNAFLAFITNAADAPADYEPAFIL